MNSPADDDNSDRDPFGPPTIPTLVACLHCNEEYESYLIEHREEPDSEGKLHGWWCCPTPGCTGRGFGFEILPVDFDWTNDEGNRIWTSDEEDEEDEDDTGWDETEESDWDRPSPEGEDDSLPLG